MQTRSMAIRRLSTPRKISIPFTRSMKEKLTRKNKERIKAEDRKKRQKFEKLGLLVSDRQRRVTSTDCLLAKLGRKCIQTKQFHTECNEKDPRGYVQINVASKGDFYLYTYLHIYFRNNNDNNNK